jgi:hypothetical protein
MEHTSQYGIMSDSKRQCTGFSYSQNAPTETSANHVVAEREMSAAAKRDQNRERKDSISHAEEHTVAGPRPGYEEGEGEGESSARHESHQETADENKADTTNIYHAVIDTDDTNTDSNHEQLVTASEENDTDTDTDSDATSTSTSSSDFDDADAERIRTDTRIVGVWEPLMQSEIKQLRIKLCRKRRYRAKPKGASIPPNLKPPFKRRPSPLRMETRTVEAPFSPRVVHYVESRTAKQVEHTSQGKGIQVYMKGPVDPSRLNRLFEVAVAFTESISEASLAQALRAAAKSFKVILPPSSTALQAKKEGAKPTLVLHIYKSRTVPDRPEIVFHQQKSGKRCVWILTLLVSKDVEAEEGGGSNLVKKRARSEGPRFRDGIRKKRVNSI